MTSFVWTIILSLMQGRFDNERLGVETGTPQQQTEEQRRSAHYAALQIHAGIPVSGGPDRQALLAISIICSTCCLLTLADVSWLLEQAQTQISGYSFRTLLGVCLTSLLLVHTVLHRRSQAATAAVAKKIFVPAEAASLAVEVAKPKPLADQLLPPSAAAAVEQVCSSSFGNLE